MKLWKQPSKCNKIVLDVKKTRSNDSNTKGKKNTTYEFESLGKNIGTKKIFKTIKIKFSGIKDWYWKSQPHI